MMQFKILTLRFEVAQCMITKIMVNSNTLRNKDLHAISYLFNLHMLLASTVVTKLINQPYSNQ
jgi:hypothetical protein